MFYLRCSVRISIITAGKTKIDKTRPPMCFTSPAIKINNLRKLNLSARDYRFLTAVYQMGGFGVKFRPQLGLK